MRLMHEHEGARSATLIKGWNLETASASLRPKLQTTQVQHVINAIFVQTRWIQVKNNGIDPSQHKTLTSIPCLHHIIIKKDSRIRSLNRRIKNKIIESKCKLIIKSNSSTSPNRNPFHNWIHHSFILARG